MFSQSSRCGPFTKRGRPSESKCRVLVIAEACHPTWNGESLVGYNVSHALASRSDLEVTLATDVRNRVTIEADEISDLAERIVYPDNQYALVRGFSFARYWQGSKSKSWTPGTAFQSLNYLCFERELHKTLRKEFKHRNFDLIHRITPCSPGIASPLSKWTEVPMILGPLYDTPSCPSEALALEEQNAPSSAPMHQVWRRFPYFRSSHENCRAVISGNRQIQTELQNGAPGKLYFMSPCGIDTRQTELAEDWTIPENTFRFVTVGRLARHKGLWLTLAAMRDSNVLRNCELHVIGDGPDRGAIEQMIDDYGLSEQVRLLGWLDHFQMSRELQDSQCFVFPSLQESRGGIVLHAMASGLPSIVIDHGGPADLVDENSGIRVPMQSKAGLVAGLRSAMEGLFNDPQRCRGYALHAIERVRDEFTWEVKTNQLCRIYQDVLGTELQSPTKEVATAAPPSNMQVLAGTSRDAPSV